MTPTISQKKIMETPGNFSFATFAVGLLMIVLTLLVVRLAVLWFFKINKIIGLLEEINSKLPASEAASAPGGAPADPAVAFPLRARRVMASALALMNRRV
jgi:hypothetical protein